VQKIFDPAQATGAGADRLDQRARAAIYAPLGCFIAARATQETGRQILIGWRESGPEKGRIVHCVIHRFTTEAMPPISAKLICLT
jgi:hypothetical protein